MTFQAIFLFGDNLDSIGVSELCIVYSYIAILLRRVCSGMNSILSSLCHENKQRKRTASRIQIDTITQSELDSASKLLGSVQGTWFHADCVAKKSQNQRHTSFKLFLDVRD